MLIISNNLFVMITEIQARSAYKTCCHFFPCIKVMADTVSVDVPGLLEICGQQKSFAEATFQDYILL